MPIRSWLSTTAISNTLIKLIGKFFRNVISSTILTIPVRKSVSKRFSEAPQSERFGKRAPLLGNALSYRDRQDRARNHVSDGFINQFDHDVRDRCSTYHL